jgi:iron complex transport system substrate-binding protein
MRIISLSPATTEILFSLGLGDRIVGVTSFCDYPPEAKKKAKIGGMSNPSLEAIVGLKPDIVVMTTDGNPLDRTDAGGNAPRDPRTGGCDGCGGAR